MADRMDPPGAREPLVVGELLAWARANGAPWARMALAQREWRGRHWSVLVEAERDPASTVALWVVAEADDLDGLLLCLRDAPLAVTVRTTRTA